MTVSVVIPTYNYAQFLPQAIDSVLAQSVKPLEIIVADDGSTDNTADVVAAYGGKIKYIRFTHRGIVAIRNDMLSEVSGDWFFNLDSDDFIPPEFLERAIPQISNAGQKTAFAYSDAVTFGLYSRKISVPEFSVPLLKKGNYVSMNSFVRTCSAREAGFDHLFDDGFEDYDFFLSLVEKGYSGLRLSGIQYHYRTHPVSRTVATEDWNASHILIEKIVRKHAAFFSPEETEFLLAKFSPDAAVRLKFSKYLWGHEYFRALKLLFSMPCPFLRYFTDRP